MFSRIGLACFVLLAASPASAHDDPTLDPRNGTPGLRLEMTELPRTSVLATRRYRLHAVGFPRGVVLSVWTQDFGHPFRRLASGFEVDESGDLASSKPTETGRPHHPSEITFGPGRYPRGAAWRVALVSLDHTFRAFTAVIPDPITARDGPCTVSLEIVSYHGDHFVATGAGFPPGDEIITESRYSGRVIQKRQRASAEGLLPLDVIAHETIDADRSARYAVKGRACELAVKYNWGTSALLRR
jgi:hypothetical protein